MVSQMVVVTDEEQEMLRNTLRTVEEWLNKLYEQNAPEAEVEYFRGTANAIQIVLTRIGIECQSVFNPLSGI